MPSWGRPLRGRWPAPSLSDRREGQPSSVALAAAACLAFGREWLRGRSRCRHPPRSPGLGRGVRRVEVGPRVGGGPLLHSMMGGGAVVVRGTGSCSVPGIQTRVASEPLAAPASATAAGKGSSAGAIARAGHGLTSNSTAFCPSLPYEFWHGRGPPGSGNHQGWGGECAELRSAPAWAAARSFTQ